MELGVLRVEAIKEMEKLGGTFMCGSTTESLISEHWTWPIQCCCQYIYAQDLDNLSSSCPAHNRLLIIPPPVVSKN